MVSRKDLIIKKGKQTKKQHTVTDIETIFSRWYDFNDHKEIFDYRNEYSTNYKFSHMYNFQNIETWFKEMPTKPNYDPMLKFAQMRNRKPLGRQLINVGFDSTADDYNNPCEADILYCNEELPLSIMPDDTFIDNQEDPYAQSDDSKDKDYIPEGDINSCTLSADETLTIANNIKLLPKKSFQHCEFENCNLEPFSTCEKCFCLLCLLHFEDQFPKCENHYPYSTDKDTCDIVILSNENRDKENNFNLINIPINSDEEHCFQDGPHNSMSKEQQATTPVNKQCEYVDCNEEIFSTCGKCLSLLCYSHFIANDTYLDCKNHASTSVQRKEKDTKDINMIQEEQEDKGLTKKGNPRKRRKFEEPLAERREKKTKLEIEKLTLKDPCTDTCKKKCTKNICDERRREINREYASLSWQLKGSFIKTLVDIKQVACRRNTNRETPKRNVTYTYYFYMGQNKIEVCKVFFLTTLGYNHKNDKRVLLALKRPIDEQHSQRGHYKRKSNFDRDVIKTHINSFGPVSSHYRREHAPHRLYLPSDITITLMHNQFSEKYPDQIVSFEVYRKIVRDEMHISFAHLGNEECEICAEYILHHDKKHESQSEDCEFCMNFKLHKFRYVESRKSYKEDIKKSANEPHAIYYSMDLQKVVMLPRMDQFKRSIFCTRIIAYNESYVPLGSAKKDTKNVPFAAVWHEAVSGRRQEDIISTLNAFLWTKRDAEHIVLWMDNCSSQNKNWAVLSFLVYIINSTHINAKTITLEYFEPGHTYMSADSFHHQVEQALQRKNKVYDFIDFVDAVRQANSTKNVVKVMEVADFYNYSDLSSQHKVRKTEPRIYLKDIMVIIAKRGEFTLKYKNNHSDKNEQILDFLQIKYMKARKFPQFVQKSSPRGIPESIKNSILKNLLNLMLDNRKEFWLSLPVSDANNDSD